MLGLAGVRVVDKILGKLEEGTHKVAGDMGLMPDVGYIQ